MVIDIIILLDILTNVMKQIHIVRHNIDKWKIEIRNTDVVEVKSIAILVKIISMEYIKRSMIAEHDGHWWQLQGSSNKYIKLKWN